MRVHLYALCWNDGKMLPFFFRHYDPFVDCYLIYDDGSTDESLEILRRHSRVEVRSFVRRHPDSFALSEQAMSNECWKESRRNADWVIVTDLDEHLFHIDMLEYLKRCRREGVSMIPALGFQMISNSVPKKDETLCWSYTVGAPWAQMMKLSIFDPNRIDDVNFSVGRHSAEPVGETVVPEIDEVMLFHYKYMGFEETHLRHQQLRAGLRERDLSERWGHKYLWSSEELETDWRDTMARALDTRRMRRNPARSFPIRPWWQKYRVRTAVDGG
jgi:hypothetical protein